MTDPTPITTCSHCGVSSEIEDVHDRGTDRICENCYGDELEDFDSDDDFDDGDDLDGLGDGLGDGPDPFKCRVCGAANAHDRCACEP